MCCSLFTVNISCLQVFRGHCSPVISIIRDVWCLAQDFLITATVTGHAYIWGTQTGQCERILSDRLASTFLAERRDLSSASSASYRSPALKALASEALAFAEVCPPPPPPPCSSFLYPHPLLQLRFRHTHFLFLYPL